MSISFCKQVIITVLQRIEKGEQDYETLQTLNKALVLKKNQKILGAEIFWLLYLVHDVFLSCKPRAASSRTRL